MGDSSSWDNYSTMHTNIVVALDILIFNRTVFPGYTLAYFCTGYGITEIIELKDLNKLPVIRINTFTCVFACFEYNTN